VPTLAARLAEARAKKVGAERGNPDPAPST
jgi:hypothetical protein